MRVPLSSDPYYIPGQPVGDGHWPCKWITCPEPGSKPFVSAYRLKFHLEKPATIRAHVSADERYELFVDGARVGRGSERGDAANWFFETHDLALDAGAHVLVARVCALGELAAFAQMTVEHGFLFSPQEAEHIALLGTGVAAWEAKPLGGYAFAFGIHAEGTGAKVRVDGADFDWGYERGEGDGWRPATTRWWGVDPAIATDHPPIHLTRPAVLPAMREEPWRGGENPLRRRAAQ